MKNRKYVYGHNKTIKQIRKEYPFDKGEADKKLILSAKYTVTYDIYLAYELRRKGYKALVWGAIYKSKRVYVIEKKPMPLSYLPF